MLVEKWRKNEYDWVRSYQENWTHGELEIEFASVVSWGDGGEVEEQGTIGKDWGIGEIINGIEKVIEWKGE